jgi:DNA repair exonuclease SbcCD ATPase subunit
MIKYNKILKKGENMALWDMIKKGAEEGLEALKEGVSVFMAEAEKQSKIIKKKVELAAVQNNVRRVFTRLGSIIYDLHGRGSQDIWSEEEVKNLINQIDGYKRRVREIEEEIEAIKKEEKGPAAPPSISSSEPPPPQNPG